MESLAMALAISVKHIEARGREAEYDDDIRALEDIAAHLQLTAPDVRNAVMEAFRQLDAPELIDELGLQMHND